MGKAFKFWWMCVKRAAGGSAAFANDWQWLLGFPALAAGISLANRWLGEGAVTLNTDTAVGALEAAGAAFIITLVAGFFIRLFSSASHFYYEEKERADALQQRLADFKASFQYRLFVTAAVEDQFISDGKKLDGRIIVHNTASEPLEYGPAALSASFQNDNPKVIKSQGRILRPREPIHYRFEFDERAMTKGNHSVIFIADLDYGFPNNRSRRLHKKIEVQYTVGDRDFITSSAARDIEDKEISI